MQLFYGIVSEAFENAYMYIGEYQAKQKEQVKHVATETLRDVGFQSDPNVHRRDSDLERVARESAERARFFVALDQHRVVGTVAIEEKAPTIAWLRSVFVLPSYQGKGVGKMLLAHALSFARDEGYVNVQLRSHRLMERAHRFYEKHGFKKIRANETRFYYEHTL